MACVSVAIDVVEKLGSICARHWTSSNGSVRHRGSTRRAELYADGEAARRRDPSTHDHLTLQELQIARFVAQGATNKEVATQLFLSPRTIDYHLRKLFVKLDIASRAELMRMNFDTSV